MALDQQLLNDIFEYRDGSLYWKVKRTRHGGIANIGDRAGSLMQIGYIGINSKLVHNPTRPEMAHRIIWVMHHGAIPEKMNIDHIDGNRLNNRIENLRCVSHQDNMRNVRMWRHNTSGINGVRKSPHTKDRWLARILNKSGKEMHLGTFKSEADAIHARQIAEILMGYHQNHGLPR